MEKFLLIALPISFLLHFILWIMNASLMFKIRKQMKEYEPDLFQELYHNSLLNTALDNRKSWKLFKFQLVKSSWKKVSSAELLASLKLYRYAMIGMWINMALLGSIFISLYHIKSS